MKDQVFGQVGEHGVASAVLGMFGGSSSEGLRNIVNTFQDKGCRFCNAN
jgi:hypothetical protein